MDIVVTGYAGYDGSVIIYKDKCNRSKLLGKYPKSFFGVFDEADTSYFVMSESAKNRGQESTGNCELLNRIDNTEKTQNTENTENEGGVLAELWRVMKEERLGGEYSMRLIPILQQTVEICEYFGLDPYRLYSPSCKVHIAHDEKELEDIMKDAGEKGIPAKVIGHVTKGPAIKRTDGAETAYLRRPEKDEIYKLLKET